MNEQNIYKQIDEINRKLDTVLEEIELQRKHRREMEDLKHDLLRVGKDLYNAAVEELEEVHDSIQTGDIIYLGKKLLRNINNITKTFEMLENAKDFLDDFSPISRELVIDFMKKLDEFDRKGYFEFMRELGRAVDNIATSFTVEDVRHFADNVGTILNTVKNLTQPDMLHTINNAVSVYKKLDIEVTEKVSIVSLIRELNTPEMKRGLAFAIKFLKSLAATQKEINHQNIK